MPAALALALLLCGCGPAGALRGAASAAASMLSTASETATSTAGSASVGSVSAGSASTAAGSIVVAQGPGWSGDQLFGPLPPAGSCHVGHEGDQVLPDRRCTPGAIDPRVTPATLTETICRRGGYTASVRPPVALTDRAKRDLLQSYGLSGPISRYELDHLVPLGVGGASDLRNLWPEQNIGSPSQYDATAPGTNAKDGVEARLHDAVCAGQAPLAAAQEAIATDWTTALARLHLAP